MFQPLDLYTKYLQRTRDDLYSRALPDITRQTTLTRINYAINLCEYWNSCLDIGCGNGHYLSALSPKFKKCTGIEIDAHDEQKALMAEYSNIEILNKAIEEHQTNERYDFILLVDIIEHIPNVQAFADKVGSFQNTGGIVYIVTPNPIFCGPASESEIFHTVSGYHGHIKHYTLKEIKEIMSKAGYEMEFNLYEETQTRQRIKRICKGFSRRDRIWSKFKLYRLIQPIVLFILKPMYSLMQIYCAHIEEKYAHNPYRTMAQTMAFKKI